MFIFSFDVYALIDPGSTLSYVTPLVARKFERIPELLVKQFEVSTPVGESIIARRVYRNCIVTVCGRDTMADLVELEMVDFDVIMGMDLLASCYATIDSVRKMYISIFQMNQSLNGKVKLACQEEDLFVILRQEE